jgi:transposase-like protein
MSLTDTLEVPVECPHCKQEFQQKLAGLKSGSNYVTCSLCVREFTLEMSGDDPQESVRAMQELERSVDDLRRKLR